MFPSSLEMTMAGTQSASIAKTAKMSSLAAGQRVVSFSSPLEALQAQREHHT
jgi:hypothetical protein